MRSPLEDGAGHLCDAAKYELLPLLATLARKLGERAQEMIVAIRPLTGPRGYRARRRHEHGKHGLQS